MPDIQGSILRSYFFGIDHLLAIRRDSLGFYKHLHCLNRDAIRIRLGPYRCWFLFHPYLIEQALAKSADEFIRFEKQMNTLRQWNGESLLISEGGSWKERRRKVLPAFKQQRMPEYAKIVAQHGCRLRDQWQQHISRNGTYTCDIDAEMAAHALDIAALTLFGQTLEDEAHKISETVHALSELAFHETTSAFTLPDFLPLPSKRKKQKIIKTMRDFIHSIAAQRLGSNRDDRGDLLSMLIEHHQGNLQAIEEDSMSLLIAGHETSGATLTWLMILLAQHPDKLRMVQHELDSVVAGTEIEFNVLSRLPYLGSTIQEAMRLYPAAYALFCRQAVKSADLGQGVAVSPGDLVQIMPYITHRDGRWFEQPDSFKPERFVAEPTWPRYAHIPFGAGPRICIGQSFGLMEVLLTAAIILQNFEPLNPLDRKPVLSPRFSLRPKPGFDLTWRLRSQN